MTFYVDISGQRYGKLVCIKREGSVNERARWLCLCDCGNYTYKNSNMLRANHVKSCGKCGARAQRKHRLSKHRLYATWIGMMGRCSSKNEYRYGGRGITVCEERYDIRNFIDDMYQTYREGLSLDRIDVDGNYCKDNCRRATQKEQANNKCNSIRILGKTASEVAGELGLSAHTIRGRLRRGWSPDEAVMKDRGKKRRCVVSILGHSIREISAQTGLKETTIRSRYSRGWTEKDIINPKLIG